MGAAKRMYQEYVRIEMPLDEYRHHKEQMPKHEVKYVDVEGVNYSNDAVRNELKKNQTRHLKH